MNECLNCGSETKTKFCSKSCAATYNNKIHKKRQPEHKCKKCSCPIVAGRFYCKDCSPRKGKHKRSLLESIYSTQANKSNNYSYIRWHARKVFWEQEGVIKKCQNCGYDKHVEVCHIKPISAFEKETLIEEVNSPENLIGLCPNCHWEFDSGVLNIK